MEIWIRFHYVSNICCRSRRTHLIKVSSSSNLPSWSINLIKSKLYLNTPHLMLAWLLKCVCVCVVVKPQFAKLSVLTRLTMRIDLAAGKINHLAFSREKGKGMRDANFVVPEMYLQTFRVITSQLGVPDEATRQIGISLLNWQSVPRLLHAYGFRINKFIRLLSVKEKKRQIEGVSGVSYE